MVSHVTVIITQVSRHVYSVHPSTIHTCEVMDGLVHEAGRSGSTPDRGITGDAERRTEGTGTGGKLETEKFHQNIVLQ